MRSIVINSNLYIKGLNLKYFTNQNVGLRGSRNRTPTPQTFTWKTGMKKIYIITNFSIQQ